MRSFFILQAVNPDTRASRGFVLRKGSGRKSYRLVKADQATLYTTRSGAVNSIPFALAGLGIEIPDQLKTDGAYYTRRRFIKKHFKVVEVRALLMPADGFLDAMLR